MIVHQIRRSSDSLLHIRCDEESESLRMRLVNNGIWIWGMPKFKGRKGFMETAIEVGKQKIKIMLEERYDPKKKRVRIYAMVECPRSVLINFSRK